MVVYHDRVVLSLNTGRKLTIKYDPKSHLPVLSVCTDLDIEANRISGFTVSVIDEDNHNLNHCQKTLLNWHYKLGHLSMQHIIIINTMINSVTDTAHKDLKRPPQRNAAQDKPTSAYLHISYHAIKLPPGLRFFCKYQLTLTSFYFVNHIFSFYEPP